MFWVEQDDEKKTIPLFCIVIVVDDEVSEKNKNIAYPHYVAIFAVGDLRYSKMVVVILLLLFRPCYCYCLRICEARSQISWVVLARKCDHRAQSAFSSKRNWAYSQMGMQLKALEKCCFVYIHFSH